MRSCFLLVLRDKWISDYSIMSLAVNTYPVSFRFYYINILFINFVFHKDLQITCKILIIIKCYRKITETAEMILFHFLT